MLFLYLLSFVHLSILSPPMCHCPNGNIGTQCPSPIELNCPMMQCPPSPPCSFPTLPPIPGVQGIAQFTFPTLPTVGSNLFGTTTPIPNPPIAPIGSQQSLLPITSQNEQQQFYSQSSQYQQPSSPSSLSIQQQQQQQQHQYVPQQQFEPTSSHSPPPPIYMQRITTPLPLSSIDFTAKTTTIPNEQYVQEENPELKPSETGGTIYESEPNVGFRQPVRRALSDGISPEIFTEKCNDERLKKIIKDNLDDHPSSSKRKIQKAATDEIGGLFDVICSTHDFSYLANTQLFCEAGNDNITCFAFLHSLIQ